MPISSGATRSQRQGSYLKRYLGSLSQEKRKVLENSLEAACVPEAAAEKVEDLLKVSGVKKEKHSEEDQSGEGEKTVSKKSSTCTML
ncbi:hypothetical protein KOW79_018467 [Hemibagrus wyckioides]|uniref:Uncharacterized protein n=1 Tax=Hemibagrus wyckioides TaxID=337641 RepID=A0A9D3SC85_9TELE|nr:hypothetical protein KOW79_018467 [Hemibagrus wyckioides]